MQFYIHVPTSAPSASFKPFHLSSNPQLFPFDPYFVYIACSSIILYQLLLPSCIIFFHKIFTRFQIYIWKASNNSMKHSLQYYTAQNSASRYNTVVYLILLGHRVLQIKDPKLKHLPIFKLSNRNSQLSY